MSSYTGQDCSQPVADCISGCMDTHGKTLSLPPEETGCISHCTVKMRWWTGELHAQPSAAPLFTGFPWYSQKDEMALLPKLHLKRAVAHSSWTTHSENFSIPLFLKKVTNEQSICLGSTSVRTASSVGGTYSILLSNIVFYAENQPLHMPRTLVSCPLAHS